MMIRIKSNLKYLLKHYRFISTIQTNEYSVDDSYLNLHEHKLKIGLIWLRDHCRCNECYNHNTRQRNLSFLNYRHNLKASTVNILNNQLDIKWDDGHVSNYNIEFLAKYNNQDNIENGLKSLYKLREPWKKNDVPLNTNFKFDRITQEKEVLKQGVKSLITNGFLLITESPVNLESTQKAVEMIGTVQGTFFGGMWEFGGDKKQEHDDTAYGNEELKPHNDGTYFSESPGLQVFHCLKRSNEIGGETVLVDGMAAIEKLKQERLRHYEILSTIPLESEYIEAGKHYLTLQPVIKLDTFNNQVSQIRFNLYDRAPHRVKCDLKQYLAALRHLSSIIFSDSFQLKILLSPGNILIIDNWRILHGRKSFNGHRHMCGCYVSRSDWISTARVLGLIY